MIFTSTRAFRPAFRALLVRLDGNYMFPPIITRGNDVTFEIEDNRL